MREVLVIKPSSLGDIIHSAGAVDAIARAGGGCRITWIVNEEYASFVRELPGVAAALPFPRRRFRWSRFPLWLPAAISWMSGLRNRFDVAVDLQGLQRSGLMARWSGAAERFGPSDARELARIYYTHAVSIPGELRHAVDRVHHLAAEVIRRSRLLAPPPGAEMSLPAADFRIPVPARARERAAELAGGASRRLVALCPGTRWESKLWPAEHWIDLIRLLKERFRDIHPILLGAPSEAEELEAIGARSGGVASNLAGRADLWETAALLERAEAAITMDSAPLHLAAAVGTPTIALFGPTEPRRVAPRGADHRVLRREELGCLACYHKRCPLERRACLLDLTPEQVIEAAAEVIS